MQPDQNVEVKAEEPKITEITEKSIETQPEETLSDKNWKKFREAREVERKQREELEIRAAQKEAETLAMKAAMEAILNKPQQRNEYHEEDLSEDQKIQKKVDEALAARDRQYEQQRIQREKAEFPQRLVQTFSDFNQVCSPENLDYLEYHNPKLAKALGIVPDGFEKWAAIYEAVKNVIPNPGSKKEQIQA